MTTYPRVLHEWARRHGLSRSQRELLEHASSGLMGPQLASALEVTISELASLEMLFASRTGTTFSAAIREIEGLVRQRSSPPAESTTMLIRQRSLQRAHERTDDQTKSS